MIGRTLECCGKSNMHKSCNVQWERWIYRVLLQWQLQSGRRFVISLLEIEPQVEKYPSLHGNC